MRIHAHPRAHAQTPHEHACVIFLSHIHLPFVSPLLDLNTQTHTHTSPHSVCFTPRCYDGKRLHHIIYSDPGKRYEIFDLIFPTLTDLVGYFSDYQKQVRARARVCVCVCVCAVTVLPT